MKKMVMILVGVLLFVQISSQEIDLRKYNNNLLPYQNYILTFTVVPPTLHNAVKKGLLLEENIGRIEDVFRLVFSNNSVELKVNPITEEYVTKNPKDIKLIEEAYTEIVMLLKYFKWFLFGNIFTSEMKLIENNDDVIKITNNYNYNGIDCENIYIIDNDLLKKIFVTRINDSQNDVLIEYDYISNNEINYLSTFQSQNKHHGFLFNLYIGYIENNSLLVPDFMTIEIVNNGITTNLSI